jgi:outer membrane protein OmpA-like peptidoglycan-associated protein
MTATRKTKRNRTMNWNRIAVLAVPVTLFGVTACGGDRVPPKSLLDARADYSQAKEGLAGRLDPTDVHEAEVSLQKAERAWENGPDEPTTVDLAIVADRKALLADAVASTMKSQQDVQATMAQIEALKNQQLKSAQGQLTGMAQTLGATQMQLEQQRATAEAQRLQLAALEAKLKDARDTIARIASVKDDARGMVITLPGEVLFKTAKYELKPGAMAKLEEIAQVLKGKELPIVVYGFTDNVGADGMNMTLSQNRAQSVRDYLVSKGIPTDLITAQGKGAGDFIADNTSVEGRAQNRRVEIVVQPPK